MTLNSLNKFLQDQVPRIASRHAGEGHEATFRQELLEGIRQGLQEDGLDPHIKLEETGVAGRIDARIEHFIFETKSPGELSKKGPRENGLTKLIGYLESFPKQNWPKYRGLLTDGYQAALASYHPRAEKFVYMDGMDVPVPSGRELLQWAEIAAPLSRMIATMAMPHLESETLLSHFGLTSPLARNSLGALWRQLDESKSEFAELLYLQWRELFALAVEFTVTDKPGEDLLQLFQMRGRSKSAEVWDQAVFVVHTYYSLLLKLLALRVVDELGLAGRVSLLDRVTESPSAALLDAERMVPQVLGNVIERDVFSWPYCDEEWPPTGEVNASISEMARRMKQFDVSGVRTDVLRRVYQKIIPPKLRKSLGEFYTPTWAAELLLNESGFEGYGRILDPTCGSGTFLVSAIHRVLAKTNGSAEERLSNVSRNVVGYDLNPIAVATSRLNYVLALVDTLKAGTVSQPLSIPVFLADSLLLPQVASPGLSPHFRIPTRVGVFHVPILHAAEKEEDVVNDTRHLLRLLRDHCTRPSSDFLTAVRRDFGAEAEEKNRQLLSKLHRGIFDLHIEKHDGVWTSIIENLFAPTLQGRFELVVGNPPWVIPRRTPQDYTNHVRDAMAASIGDEIVLKPAKKDFLFKSRSAAAEEQYFACTPFVWRTLRSYAAPKGRVAFLMTSSMLTSLGAGGWRKWITRFSIKKIIDMTLVTDIHEGALCWSYIPIIENQESNVNDSVDYSFCIPLEKKEAEQWDIGPRMEWRKWQTSKEYLPIYSSRIRTGNGNEPSEAPWLVAPTEVVEVIRKMKNGGNRLGDIYPMHMGFKADGWKYFGFKDLPSIEKGVATGKNLAGETMVVDAQFVFATAIARGLRPWRFNSNYAFLPLDGNGNQLSEKEMKKYDLTWQYLLSHKRELIGRGVVKKGYVNEWFGVLVPEAAKAGGKVAYRLIREQLEVSVLPLEFEFANHKTLLLPDQSVRFIPVSSLQESHYLAGVMNSSSLRCVAYLCASPKGGIPSRQFMAWNVGFIPIRNYNPKDPIHKRIARLASQLSKKPETTSADQDEVDELVAQAYDLTKRETSLLKAQLSTVMGEIASHGVKMT
jgi:hypothetical protein